MKIYRIILSVFAEDREYAGLEGNSELICQLLNGWVMHTTIGKCFDFSSLLPSFN